MSAETLGDVLDLTRDAHAKLAERIDRSSQSATERDKMLLDYLAQHEQKLSHALEQAKQDASMEALNTWCADYFARRPSQKIDLDSDFEGLKTDEILARVIGLHDQLIELYRFLGMRADVSSTQELIDGLISLEKHEAMVMARDTQRLEGI